MNWPFWAESQPLTLTQMTGLFVLAYLIIPLIIVSSAVTLFQLSMAFKTVLSIGTIYAAWIGIFVFLWVKKKQWFLDHTGILGSQSMARQVFFGLACSMCIVLLGWGAGWLNHVYHVKATYSLALPWEHPAILIFLMMKPKNC